MLAKTILSLSILLSLSACSESPTYNTTQKVVMNNPLCVPDKSGWRDEDNFVVWSCYKDPSEMYQILKDKKSEVGDTNTPYLDVTSAIQDIYFSKDDYQPTMIFEYINYQDGTIFKDRLSNSDMYEVIDELANPHILDDYKSSLDMLKSSSVGSSMFTSIDNASMMIYAKARGKYK